MKGILNFTWWRKFQPSRFYGWLARGIKRSNFGRLWHFLTLNSFWPMWARLDLLAYLEQAMSLLSAAERIFCLSLLDKKLWTLTWAGGPKHHFLASSASGVARRPWNGGVNPHLTFREEPIDVWFYGSKTDIRRENLVFCSQIAQLWGDPLWW